MTLVADFSNNKVAKQKTKKVAKPKVDKEFKQCRNWCFTDFGLTNWETLYQDNKDIIRYICWGREICPKTKKPHHQGWIQFVNKKTLGGVKKLMGNIHLAQCLGTELQNDKYCKKDGNFKEFGKFKIQGHRTDFENIKKKLDEEVPMLEIAEDHFGDYLRYFKGMEKYQELVAKEKSKEFRNVEVIVHCGATGTGKTREAMKEATYKTEGAKLKWWDGYKNDKCIVIDEFANQVTITELLNLLDGYQLRLDVKGCHTYARWEKVYLTTNLSWDEWYPNAHPEHRKALARRISVWKNFVNPENCRSDGEGNTDPSPSSNES